MINENKKLDSRVVVLGDDKYMVYLKRVLVKSAGKEQRTVVKAFVKKIGKRKSRKSSKIKKIVNSINKKLDRLIKI